MNGISDEDTIYRAAQRGDVDAVHRFLEVELKITSLRGNLEVVNFLLQNGDANANARHRKWGFTALISATYHQEGLTVVPTLLKHGVNINPTRCSTSSILLQV